VDRLALSLLEKVNVRGALLAVWLLPLAGCATSHRVAPGETIHSNLVYTQRGERALHLDLFVPASPRPVPVVVWIHGGAWSFGNKGFLLRVRDLVREGFAVASVEYRFSGVATYPGPVDDCREALAWLRANGARYGVDGSRLGLSGHSSGAHFAALIGAIEGRPQIKAVLLLAPPTDLIALNDYYGGTRNMNAIARFLGGPVPDRTREAVAANPITHIRADTPPFLIYHGAADQIVPLSQSEILDRALRRHGVPSDRIVLPKTGHNFALRADQMRHVADFFRKNL
jgi:acetyl esterase/lipase